MGWTTTIDSKDFCSACAEIYKIGKRLQAVEDWKEELIKNNSLTNLQSLLRRYDKVKQELEVENTELKNWNTRLAGSLKEKEKELEKLRMQLASCSQAAFNNGETTLEMRLKKDSVGWSASYQDVCDAVDREIALRKEHEKYKMILERIKMGYEDAEHATNEEVGYAHIMTAVNLGLEKLGD